MSPTKVSSFNFGTALNPCGLTGNMPQSLLDCGCGHWDCVIVTLKGQIPHAPKTKPSPVL